MTSCFRPKEETPAGTGLWSITGLSPQNDNALPSTGASEAGSASSRSSALASSTTSWTPLIPQAEKSAKSSIPQPGSTPWTSKLKCPKCRCCTRCPCENHCCPCSCCRALRWACLLIFLFIVGLGITVLVLWKVLKPKFPGYNVENVEFSYHTHSVGPSTIFNSETYFTMVLSNPNTKIGILYDRIALSLHMFGLDIGDQTILGVFDGCGITQNVNGSLLSGNVPLDAPTQAELMAADSANDVPLNLDIVIQLRAKIGLLLTPAVQISLACLIDINPSAAPGSQLLNMACKFKFKLA